MSKRPKRPEKIDTSPEAMEKQAQRRRARERNLEAEQRRLKAERAQVLHSLLNRYGSAGLITIEGVSGEIISKFREGFEIELDKRLLFLPAEGTIQGADYGEEFAEETIGRIDDHEKTFGATGVLGFEDTDFSGHSGIGTPQVADHVVGILQTGRNRERLAIVAFGSGDIHDMPTSPSYDHALERGLVGRLATILGLDHRGEPRTFLEPGLRPEFVSRSKRPVDQPGMQQEIDFGAGPSIL